MQSQDVTIFMVDDDAVDVMAVERALKRANLKNPLVVAQDGQAALDKLRAKELAQPFMVLLDLNMPRMGGIDFLKAARQDEDLKSAVIFVLTTSSADEDKDKAYQHSIAGYVVKDREGAGFGNVAELVRQYATFVEFPN